MIVRPGADGTLLLITQPAHARLAATLMSAWDWSAAAPSATARGAVLFAIAEHDNGWKEVDAAPLLSAATARPHDFMDLPAKLKREIWPRGVERIAAQSPLAAALVAQHALTLHAHRKHEPQWRDFFKLMEDLQGRLLQQCAAQGPFSREAFDRSYDLLYVGDLVSLVFCNRWTDQAEARGCRITLAAGGDEDAVLIAPDPFNGARVHFEVCARAIADREYASGEDLRTAYEEGRQVTLRGSARGVQGTPVPG